MPVRVTSADGTRIAFERLGAGERPVLVVGGATCDRAKMRPVSEELARHVSVINYDRRGRGAAGTPRRTRSSARSTTSPR